MPSQNLKWRCNGVPPAYINAALRKAHYEILPDGEGYYGTIEGLLDVWAQANTLEACREELREVLPTYVFRIPIEAPSWERVRKARKLGLKEVANEALRHGLTEMMAPSRSRLAIDTWHPGTVSEIAAGV